MSDTSRVLSECKQTGPKIRFVFKTCSVNAACVCVCVSLSLCVCCVCALWCVWLVSLCVCVVCVLLCVWCVFLSLCVCCGVCVYFSLSLCVCVCVSLCCVYICVCVCVSLSVWCAVWCVVVFCHVCVCVVSLCVLLCCVCVCVSLCVVCVVRACWCCVGVCLFLVSSAGEPKTPDSGSAIKRSWNQAKLHWERQHSSSSSDCTLGLVVEVDDYDNDTVYFDDRWLFVFTTGLSASIETVLQRLLRPVPADVDRGWNGLS